MTKSAVLYLQRTLVSPRRVHRTVLDVGNRSEAQKKLVYFLIKHIDERDES